MQPIISVQGLGKSYTIRHEGQTHYRSLREEIFKLPGRLLKKSTARREEFWALRDVNFDIMPGERVGIIGRNGAGKSTLLKLLSRITVPTTGRITLRGRVASLLEVGTGFHPELTGRENIFLNGAILGMSRAEVRRKFDEIVDFAGVEKFLDTPVKRYSSGMYVRLAFAVAAHLEPEILIVDEVLAVGDAEFQKKCLGKMEEVGREGRTVLFVSHNMTMIKYLCNKAMLIENGHLSEYSNDIKYIIGSYMGRKQNLIWKNKKNNFKSEYLTPISMALVDKTGGIITDTIGNDSDVWIEMEVDIHKLCSGITIGYSMFLEEEGDELYWSYHTDQEEEAWPRLELGKIKLRSKFPNHFLNEGKYRIEMNASIHCQQWLIAPRTGPRISFEIKGGLSNSPLWQMRRPGILAPLLPWVKV